ncbi:MAG TPA: cytochrome c [Gemmatimonadales bacterium]|nr:cytochrome c [Gemmatimonadales bacterium]
MKPRSSCFAAFTWCALAGVALPGPLVAAQAGRTPAQTVEAGARVFLDKGCNGCHAVNGLGGKVGPDLARLRGRRSFYHLAAALWNHIPQMRREMGRRGVTQPRLAPWEAGDLMAFLYWLDYFDEPGDARHGARLFQDRQCVRCHQVRGRGGVIGPDLGVLAASRTPIMIATGMWNHAPEMARAMRAQGVRRPTFTGTELRDLLAYVKGVESEMPSVSLFVVPGEVERGRALFEQKQCVRCHGGAAAGRVGPDLRAQRRYASVLDFAAAMWNKGPAMVEEMRARGVAIPKLEAGEMADLVSYLYAGQYFADAGDAARGAQVVRERCAGCHAEPQGAAPRLETVRGLDSPAAVVASLWNHLTARPGSGGWPSLNAGDVADVTAYLQSESRAR